MKFQVLQNVKPSRLFRSEAEGTMILRNVSNYIYQSTQRHISEDFSLQHHNSEELRSRTLDEFITNAAVSCLQLQRNILLCISRYRRSHATHGIRKPSDPLGAFAKLQKKKKLLLASSCLSVCLSVRPSVRME